MALLDRVKERLETDLTDTELNAIIADAQSEVDDRFGVVGQEITVILAGYRRMLDIIRPIDTDKDLEVTDDDVVVDPGMYLVLNGGRTLSNRAGKWGEFVEVKYTPKDDSSQRDEVIVELAILSAQHQGISSNRVGDVSTNHADLPAQREAILNRLSPRNGLFAR